MTQRNDYLADRADADELIDEFGQDGTISRATTTGPAHSPTPGTPETYPATFAVLDYSNREIDGTRVLMTDKKVLLSVAGLSIEPKTSDKLLIGGVTHSIIRVEPLAPGGVVVMWTLQCRR